MNTYSKHLYNIMNTYSYGVIYMPRFDGTGPGGKGPRTGRGKGKCKPKKPKK